MSSKRPVFISYRRDDDPGYVLALYQVLEDRLGSHALFKDIEGGFRDGDDFYEELARRVAECHVLLAVIGPKWASIEDEHGHRRLDNPNDWVRVEVGTALAAGKRVIPVLVNNTPLPKAEELPHDMATLARKQARKLSNERFAAEAGDFANGLAKILEEIENEPEPTPEPKSQLKPQPAPALVSEQQMDTEQQSDKARQPALEQKPELEPKRQTKPRPASASASEQQQETEPLSSKAPQPIPGLKLGLKPGKDPEPGSATGIRLSHRLWPLVALAFFAVVVFLLRSQLDACDQLTLNSSIEEVLKCQQR